jgi:ribosome assembly protein 1
MRHSVEAGVMAGFQMASGAGPLCEEPLWGIVFEVSQPPKQAPAESLSINTMLDQLA